jgi:isopentenyl-diphosphate delta-isomerase
MEDEEDFARSKEKVILVDKNDKEIGTGEKLKIHQEGKLHRAFSIFVFNYKGELLLQQRAKSKYHSGGLWANTCCSHPRVGEPIEKAVHRRLKEEMGFDCDLKKIFSFTYKSKLDHDFFEHEFDHVFVGKFNGKPMPNPEEVDKWKWVNLEELKKDIQKNPNNYTYWLKASIDKIMSYLS